MNMVVAVPTGSKTNSRKLITWLRKRTCGLVYGVRIEDAVVPATNTLDVLRDKINSQRPLPTLKNPDYEAHFRGDQTYYFWAGHRADQHEVIFEIDIDVQKALGRGSTEGAWSFARHLQKKFTGLYCEPSTRCKGVHGIAVLQKGTLGAAGVRKLLLRFEQWLRDESARINADIELVEVTGLPAIFRRNRGVLSFINPGVWAKIPRDATRSDEIMQTYSFSTRELSRLDVSVEPGAECLPHDDGYIAPADREIADILTQTPPNRRGRRTNPVLVDALDDVLAGVSPACPLVIEAVGEIDSGVVAPEVQEKYASRKKHKLKNLPSPRSKMFEVAKRATYGHGEFINPIHIQIFANAVEKSGGFAGMKVGLRRRVQPAHVGILLAILKHCSRTVYADGTMPSDRIMGLWRCLKEAEVIQYAANYEIFKAVRDRLADMGLLEEEDWTYLPPQSAGDLRLEGRGAKWRLSKELLTSLDALLAEQADDGNGKIYSTNTQGGEMVHTLFAREKLLMPGGRPMNQMERMSRAAAAQEQVEAMAYVYG